MQDDHGEAFTKDAQAETNLGEWEVNQFNLLHMFLFAYEDLFRELTIPPPKPMTIPSI